MTPKITANMYNSRFLNLTFKTLLEQDEKKDGNCQTSKIDTAIRAVILVGSIIIVIFVALLLASIGYLTPNTNYVNQRSQPTPTPEPEFVNLQIDLYETQGVWIRSMSTGLPEYHANANYAVTNTGNKYAQNVIIEVYVDGVFQKSEVRYIASGQTIENSVAIPLNYDESKNVFVQVSCQENQLNPITQAIDIQAKLPRETQEFKGNNDFYELYVTPNDPEIVSLAKSIPTNILVPDWMETRNWVSNHITYQDDNTIHGTTEYWQLPRETLNLKTGDCEDYAILTMSLLRAEGWNANQVYVVLGTTTENGETFNHAFVKLQILGLWYWYEPENASWTMLLLGDFNLAQYHVTAEFNDQNFHLGEAS